MSMGKYIETLMLILLISIEGTASSYEFEDRIGMPTDAENRSIFTRNMSMVKIDKAIIDVSQVTGKRKIDVIGDPGTGNQEVIQYDIEEKDQAVGFLLPLGGASFGADTTLTTKDVTVQIERNGGGELTETFRDRTWRLHFLVDLTRDTHAGFSYRYLQMENDLLGEFFLSRDDRTDYLGELSGYMVNFYSTSKAFGWGGYYAPPLRGKSEIEGEQKILTTPGTAGLNFVYTGNKKWTLGFEATKWFYKSDDRGELSTSPDDQRTISLNGLDIEQRLLNTQRMSLGADFMIKKDVKIRANVYKQDAVWLFRGDLVPGDDVRSETAMTYRGSKIALHYDQKQFYLQFGIIRVTRDLDSFRDTNQDESWFGHRTYGSYSVQEEYSFLGLGFEN